MQGMRAQSSSGFGLLELMIVLVVAGLLASVAIPAYSGVIHKARFERAIGDIGTIHIKIEEYQLKNNHQLPASLSTDGSTSGPLSATSGRDDIVRASNGAFVGLGVDC